MEASLQSIGATNLNSASDAELTNRLEPMKYATERILQQVFGSSASVTMEVETHPDSSSPSIVFCLSVPRAGRNRRTEFLDRYVRETELPDNVPAPALSWRYVDHAQTR